MMNNDSVFYNDTHFVIWEKENRQQVNENYSDTNQILALTASILIIVLIFPTLYKFSKHNITFINVMVILDCLNSAAHIPILLYTLKYVIKICLKIIKGTF